MAPQPQPQPLLSKWINYVLIHSITSPTVVAKENYGSPLGSCETVRCRMLSSYHRPLSYVPNLATANVNDADRRQWDRLRLRLRLRFRRRLRLRTRQGRQKVYKSD